MEIVGNPALIVEVLETNEFGNPLYAGENRENQTPLDIIGKKSRKIKEKTIFIELHHSLLKKWGWVFLHFWKLA